MTWNNKIETIEIVQNKQEFLFGTFQIRQVKEFTRYTKHLIVGYEEVEDEDQVFLGTTQIKPIYNPEIQRKVNPSKVEKIADFLINDPKAMFPTNIVIAIPEDVIDSMDREGKNVCITLNESVNREIKKTDGHVYLTIIDGQHRIRGIERAIERINENIGSLTKVINSSNVQNLNLENELKKQIQLLEHLMKFELLVTFFVGIPLEYQAMIFATINKTQTKVPENLVFSLFGLTKNDSPQKTSLEVVLALNGIESSPFFNRVKLIGGSYSKGELIPLSQATMVKSILKNIVPNSREQEIARFKDRNFLKDNPKKLIFRQYYANNNDKMIVRVMYSFFSAVKETFVNKKTGESLWTLPDSNKVENILQTNVGYQALLKILFFLIYKIPLEQRDSKAAYISFLEKAKQLDFEDENEEKRYPFTSKSINILYQDIKNEIERN